MEGRITRRGGIAGQVQIDATIIGEGRVVTGVVSFVGSEAYGGPVVMIGESGAQTFVTDPSRFGSFGVDWVKRFMESGTR